MFTNKQHGRILSFFEMANEGSRESEGIVEWTIKKEKIAPEVSQNEQNQAQIETKKAGVTDAQKKTIELGNTLERVANEKVEAIQKTNLFDRLGAAERRIKIQELVNEFMTTYKAQYDTLKASLEALDPPLTKEEILVQLKEQEALSFEQFVNAKKKEIIEKRKKQRQDRYLKAFVSTNDPETDALKKDLIEKFDPKYADIRKKLLEDRPELIDKKDELRKEIRKAIDIKFLEYCSENSIEIDTNILETELHDDAWASDGTDSDITDDYIQIQTSGSILQAQNEYLEAAKTLVEATQVYQIERAKYESVEVLEVGDVAMTNLPARISLLPPGESISFLGSSGWGDMVYEATREADGEYTLKFNGHTMKNLPKKEMEVIVDLNSIPVINSIFTVNSRLYQTLLREYKLLCMMGGTDALENPPLWFIDFLYNRLSDAYMATLPENGDNSLLWFSIDHMPYKDRWKYIRGVLSWNIEMRSEVIKKLEQQKILTNGKINLSRYPR